MGSKVIMYVGTAPPICHCATHCYTCPVGRPHRSFTGHDELHIRVCSVNSGYALLMTPV
jgi:hypothetical protein